VKEHIFQLLLSVIALCLLVPDAMGQSVVVGTCRSGLPTYPTISQAVTAVTPYSTVLVCPGNYPEQVTITQPLTLRGLRSRNAANPTITVPAAGLRKAVASDATAAYYQVLVQDTGFGAVNIYNMSVDGGNRGQQLDAGFVGVAYVNSSGRLTHSAIYNQTGNGIGFGANFVCTTASPVTVAVIGNSIHDFDQAGLSAGGNLRAVFRSNVLVASSSFTGAAPNGIVFYTRGIVSDNLVVSHPQPPGISAETGIAVQSNVVVTYNTIEAFTIGIWALGDSNKVLSNKLLQVNQGIVVNGSNNDMEYNNMTGLPNVGVGISLYCASGNIVIHNVVNDSSWGIFQPHSGDKISPNEFFNVANILSPPC